MEDKQKEFDFEKTKELRYELDNINKDNINSVDDRITVLKNKLNKMLSDPQVKKNADIFYPAYNLYKKLINLSSELNLLEKKINKYYEANRSLVVRNTSHINKGGFFSKNKTSNNFNDKAAHNAENIHDTNENSNSSGIKNSINADGYNTFKQNTADYSLQEKFN